MKLQPGESKKIQTRVRGAVARLFTERPTGELVISGPAGTGKTRAILEWIHMRCATEKIRVLILRKTLTSLQTSAAVTYTEQVLDQFDGKYSLRDGVSYFGGNRLRPAEFTYGGTGSKVILGGLDNAAKVLSTEYDIIYVNECTELSLFEWELIGGRIDRPSVGNTRPSSLLLGDCNPGPPQHWIVTRAAKGTLTLWRTTHRDNPAMYDIETGSWTEAGKRYLRRLNRYTSVRRMRFLRGEWAAAEGQVYDMFDPRVHVIRDRGSLEDRLWGATYFGTVDWGWTRPGVLQVWALDSDRRLYLMAEYYATRQLLENWWLPRATMLSRHYGFNDWFCDPSEPANIALFQTYGLNAQKAPNNLLDGIKLVQGRLDVEEDGLPRLFILEDASQHIDEDLADQGLPLGTLGEFTRYVWAENKQTGQLKDVPLDEHNHAMDTTRYAVLVADKLGYAGGIDPRVASAFARRSMR